MNALPLLRRRQLLKLAGAAGASGLGLGTLAHLSAAAQSTGDYKALVCLFMYGGNDGNNLLVPLDLPAYEVYRRARTNLALARDSLLPIAPSNTGGASFGLHPAMAGLQGLFTQGKAAMLANIGPLAVPTTKAQWEARSVPVPDNLFSHSDQQAQWQSAIVDAPPRSGWGGRMIERLLAAETVNRGYGLISVAGGNLWEKRRPVAGRLQGVVVGPLRLRLLRRQRGRSAVGRARRDAGRTAQPPARTGLDRRRRPLDRQPARPHAGARRQHGHHGLSRHRARHAVADGGAPDRGALQPGPVPAVLLLLDRRLRHPRRRPVCSARTSCSARSRRRSPRSTRPRWRWACRTTSRCSRVRTSAAPSRATDRARTTPGAAITSWSAAR